MVDKMFHALLLSPTLMVNNVYKSREKWYQNGFQTFLVDGSNTQVNTFMHNFTSLILHAHFMACIIIWN
jgi:hypothetical protein